MNQVGGTDQLDSTSQSGLGRIADDHGRKGIHFLDLPLGHSLVLFLVIVALHAGMLSGWFASDDGTRPAIILGIGASIVLLAYLCLAFSLNTRPAPKRDLRQPFNVVLVWLSFAAIVLVDGAWLSHAYPNLHPAKTLGGIFLLLPFLLFASPLCGAMPAVRNMPESHWLYLISTSLSAFVVFIANPIGLYVSSNEDFVGGVYKVAGTLLALFGAAFLALTALYLLLDKPARNGLTLLSVFSAVSVMVYSSIGLKRAGLMTHFILHIPEGLVLASYEIVAEIAALLVLFGAASYATIRYRQEVTYVVGAMLATSLAVTAVDMHGAENNAAAAKAFPADHADIIGFSRERNVLILMLDGFPGGLLKTIMAEVPDVLREFQGFTWYPNTLSAGFETMTGIAVLAGGPKYSAQEINSRNYETVGSAINEAYGVYVDAFAPKGYQVTYVNPAFYKCEGADKRIHCIDSTLPYGVYYRDKEEPEAPLLQGDSHVPILLAMVSLLKASPFILKSRIYDNENYLGANALAQKSAILNTTKVMEGWGFLRMLARESHADSTSKTFKFIQLNLPHGPNALNHECKLRPETATMLTESVCALKAVGALLTWMREVGIYDVTKIVVVSDHGWHIDNPMFAPGFEKVFPQLDGFFAYVPGHVQPLLLVKDFDAKGDFRRADTFLSNADVPAIVCGAEQGCRDIGPDPIANSVGPRKLYFTYASWPRGFIRKQKQYDIKAIFEVRDSIFAPENWTRIK